MSFRRETSSSSTKPSLALAWASEIDVATDVDQLRTSVYNQDGVSIDFETLDTKVAAGLMKVMQGDFKKRITMRDEQHQVLHKDMLTGRHIASLMFQHFHIADLDNSMLEFSDLLVLELKGDHLRAFDTAWDDTLLGMTSIPDEEYFGTHL